MRVNETLFFVLPRWLHHFSLTDLTLKKPWSDKTAHATLDACHFVSSSDMILKTQCKFLFWCIESAFNLSFGVA